MSVLRNLALAIPFVAMAALGGTEGPYNASTDINLASTSPVTLVSVSTSGVGDISTIACTVTQALTLGSTSYLTVELDSGSTLTIDLYSGGTSWSTDVSPWARGSNGASVGDSFVLSLINNNYFTSSLLVKAFPGGGNGHLRCNVLYDNE